MTTFTVKTRWATYDNCGLVMNYYADNNHIALSVFSPEEGPIANITVNLPQLKLYKNECAFVDTNNFPEAEGLIYQLGIGRDTGISVLSGYCFYPLYRFDIQKIKEML